MSDTQQELGPFERLVTIELAESDLEPAKNRVARKISREIKIKGFRPGKAPRRLVEATVGADRVRVDAIDEMLPEAVGEALEGADLEPAVTPVVEAMRDVDGGVEVDVKVTLWPTLAETPDYEGREIGIDHPAVDDEAVGGQIDRLREQFAELETVERAAQEGDFTSINLSTTANGAPLDEVSATDLLYEVGSESLLDGLDSQLHGRTAGTIEQFDTVLPDRFGDLAGTQVSVQVLVKEVKEKRLPEVTDEWVSDFTEFDTVEELRAELSGRMADMQLQSTRAAFQAKLVETLVDELDVDIPEGLIDGEMEQIFHRFSHQLAESGVELGDYLEVTGMSQEVFIDDLRQQASRSVTTDLLLDAIAESAGLEVDDEEVAAVYEGLAAQSEDDAATLAERFTGTVQEKRIVGDILRRKALETVVLGAVAVDEDGNPIDLRFDELGDENDGADGTSEDIEASVEDVENGTAEPTGDTVGDAVRDDEGDAQSGSPEHLGEEE